MKLLFILLIPTLLFACERMKGEKLEGIYSCEVVQYYWQIGNPGVHEYDTSFTVITVVREKDSLDINGLMVPVSSVLKEKKYHYGGYHYSGDVQFKNNSMIMFPSNMIGLGGGYQYSYDCQNQE